MVVATALVGCGDDAAAAVTRCADPTDRSAAQVWNEVALDAIRRDEPDPTVHARNLYHLSAALWDVWAAFDPNATPLFAAPAVPADLGDDEVAAVRLDALHHAAATVLDARYRNAEGRTETLAQVAETLDRWCGTSTGAGDEAPGVGLGRLVAASVLDAAFDDGSNERLQYQDFDYRPVNPPLDPEVSGAEMVDPNRWQPLTLETAIAQNGLPLPSGPQEFLGSQWGTVTGFALAPSADGLPIDPGPPPLLGGPGDDEFRSAIIDVIAAGAGLETGVAMIDISPGDRGANPLGTDDGTGHPTNPVTNTAYAPNVVDAGDHRRIIAEYWADGPDSETPPGHWNVIANDVSDRLAEAGALRIGGDGDPLARLEWDIKLHLALNGAAHDAAVAAWGAKAHYDYVRPISMIRWAAALGQSTDEAQPAHHPDGLTLVDGLVELITAESAAPGAPHAHLADHIGEVAVRSWRGSPDDPAEEVAGVGWILGVDWVPYQRPTFVTPSFAAYVSGHSAFSRAAAEVLTAFTGSEFFPGGLAEWTVPAGALLHEDGPTEDVTLQWATYFDAADDAGRSRIHGGIHVVADDHAGRRLGAVAGQGAWKRATELFG